MDELIDLKEYNEDCLDPTTSELKECAWNILHENPGTEFGDWQSMLLEQFPLELVDALGTNPEDIFSQLADWWSSMDYEDEATGMCERFCDWAEYFSTGRSVELYDMFAEAQGKIRPLENR